MDGNEAYLKRQKITSSSRSGPPAGPPIEIRSGKQLRQVLAFDQDSGRSKQGNRLSTSNQNLDFTDLLSNTIFESILGWVCDS